MKDDEKSASRFGAKPTDGLCAVLPKDPRNKRRYIRSRIIQKKYHHFTLFIKKAGLLLSLFCLCILKPSPDK